MVQYMKATWSSKVIKTTPEKSLHYTTKQDKKMAKLKEGKTMITLKPSDSKKIVTPVTVYTFMAQQLSLGQTVALFLAPCVGNITLNLTENMPSEFGVMVSRTKGSMRTNSICMSLAIKGFHLPSTSLSTLILYSCGVNVLYYARKLYLIN